MRDVFRMRRQEHVGRERLDVGMRRRAIRERGALDRQAVVLDRIEDAQSRIGRIARQQDHLDARRAAAGLIEPQQFLYEWKCDARREQFVLAAHLVGAIGVESVAFEQRMTLAQIEQRA